MGAGKHSRTHKPKNKNKNTKTPKLDNRRRALTSAPVGSDEEEKSMHIQVNWKRTEVLRRDVNCDVTFGTDGTGDRCCIIL